MSRAATHYDPFDRDEERRLEDEAAAREAHQIWSLEQARKGQSAAQRDGAPTWISLAPKLPPEAQPRS